MRKRIIFAIALSASALVVGGAVPAFADGATTPTPTPAPTYPHTFVNPTAAGSSGGLQPADTTFSQGTLADSKSAAAHPTGGSSSTIKTGYSTTVTLFGDESVFTGTSYGEWLGATPVDASSISLTDSLSVASVGSVGISAGGSGVTTGASVVQIKSTVSKTRKVTHSFSNVTFTGLIISETEDSILSVSFGSQLFVVDN
jgi:hypothetical protein